MTSCLFKLMTLKKIEIGYTTDKKQIWPNQFRMI